MKIRVLIVEDSRFYQRYLCKVMEADPLLEVAGIAGTGQEARDMAEKLEPDIITLDLSLPDVTGFELLTDFTLKKKTPVIVVSSRPQVCETAIRLGARDFIEKVSDTKELKPEQFALLLQMKVKMQANGARKRRILPERLEKKKVSSLSEARSEALPCRLIAMGASLGGTESTLEVLSELPATMPGIVIVQHMPRGFTKPYAARLDKNCHLKVSEAKDGDQILPGRVLVAESGKHMTVLETPKGLFVRSREGEKVNNFCPSVDVLFSSAAKTKTHGIGVILSGIGQDGAEGMKKMKQEGFYTIGQSQESCAVYGMPRAAYLSGVVDAMLDPAEIAQKLIEKCQRHR
ncbi:MAG: chemotaxis-specific protein-glutamate methyltransferase CheB [Lachnospiraceae bacterium]|nr:chemotaxis-specific protein-glutamate methyltransferase CheB [Lachnospiraceae bacterium]